MNGIEDTNAPEEHYSIAEQHDMAVKNAADRYNGRKDEHGRDVGDLLQGVELFLCRRGKGARGSLKDAEGIVSGLEEKTFQVTRSDGVVFPEAAGTMPYKSQNMKLPPMA